MRAQPLSSPSLALRLTIVLGGLALGCGRVPLDLPVIDTGAAGTAAGQTGAAGASGTFTGTAGTAAFAGTTGTFTGTAGTAAAGTTGTFTGAAGTMGARCAPATSICAGNNGEVQVCGPDGLWGVPSVCQLGCSNGVCRECIPGDTDCVSATSIQSCLPNAVWSVPADCGGTCSDGACSIVVPVCAPGSNQCVTDSQAQLCTAAGTWGDPFTCANGCSNGICRECIPTHTSCVSLSQVQTCLASGIWSPTTTCQGVCLNDVCAATAKLVFATSMLFEGGALGGLAGADAICQKLAVIADLPGTYKAWLSDSQASPSTRFTQGGAPYVLRDGTVVALNWMVLTSGNLQHAIDEDEIGERPTSGTAACGDQLTVWTDTSTDGTLTDPGATCGNWSDVTATGGAWGDATQTANWSVSCGGFGTFNGAPLCSVLSALYCFEQ